MSIVIIIVIDNRIKPSPSFSQIFTKPSSSSSPRYSYAAVETKTLLNAHTSFPQFR
jgi:hypothetical protein